MKKRTQTSDLPRDACSIALFPFWRLDAKGGEVVLLVISVGFAWVGHKLIRFLEIFRLLVSIYLSVELIWSNFMFKLWLNYVLCICVT